MFHALYYDGYMPSDKPDIHRLIALQQMLLEFQAINRVLYLPGKTGRLENDTEHSYNLAMMAWFLAQYFPQIDRDAVIRLALVHDLVEIHAGDTFPFNNHAQVATKQQREMAALHKLAAEWTDFPEMVETLRAYEARETEAAKFVYALDKLMPPLVNIIEGGRTWREHSVTLTHLQAVKTEKVAISPEISPYYADILDILSARPELFGTDTSTLAQN
jgi:putative hydrolases of HD superfamily